MGQYYTPVNIDKGEYIHPHSMGDGLKLLEFGMSGFGTMGAVALLLASGNGRGGGDIMRSGPSRKVKARNFERVEEEFNISRMYYSRDEKHRIVVPKIVGHWAGDRIVIAGDYADPDLFGIRTSRNNHPDDFADNGTDYGHQRNLYSLAKDQYKNISGQVIAAMCADPMICDEYAKMYVDRGPESDHPFVVAMKEAMKINRGIAEKVKTLSDLAELNGPGEFRGKMVNDLYPAVKYGPNERTVDIRSPQDIGAVDKWLASHSFGKAISRRGAYFNEYCNIHASLDDKNGSVHFEHTNPDKAMV